MNTNELVVKINELKSEIQQEAGGNPAHIDTFLIIDLAREIDELQDALWELES